jgi:hypothetical protein
MGCANGRCRTKAEPATGNCRGFTNARAAWDGAWVAATLTAAMPSRRAAKTKSRPSLPPAPSLDYLQQVVSFLAVRIPRSGKIARRDSGLVRFFEVLKSDAHRVHHFFANKNCFLLTQSRQHVEQSAGGIRQLTANVILVVSIRHAKGDDGTALRQNGFR